MLSGGGTCVVDPLRNRRPPDRRVEQRKRVRAVPEHGDTERLQVLHRRRDVEERLRAGARHEHRRGDEGDDVRGHVRRIGVAAVDAADPSRPEEADPDAPRDDEEPADGGSTGVAGDHARGEVTGTDLERIGREAPELVLAETDADAAVEHACRRRYCAGRAHRPIALQPDLDSGGSGKAVRDEGRLERDHGRAVLERKTHLVGNLDQLVHAPEPR